MGLYPGGGRDGRSVALFGREEMNVQKNVLPQDCQNSRWF
jgi:hypothetical protein